MRAKDFITELFNSTGVEWDTQDDDIASAYFTASNGIDYRIDILAPHVGPDELSPYDFFSADLPDEIYERARFVEFEQVDANSTGKQGIEGTGAAAEIFGTVINALLQYIKKSKPSMLYFQAVESNRQRLYARIMSRLAATLSWGFQQDSAHFVIYNKKLKKYLENEQ